MNILFVTDRSFPPDQAGGAGRTADALLQAMRQRRHACEVVAMRRYAGARFMLYRSLHAASLRRWIGWSDRVNGYETHRCAGWHIPRLVEQRIRRFKPDVLFVDDPRLALQLPSDPPRLLRVVDTMARLTDAELEQLARLAAFSNSRFTAGHLAERWGIETPVLYPMVQWEHYRVRRPTPKYITFINPIPLKGLETALGVARLLPHRSFLFVEAWHRSPADRAEFLRELSAHCPNVTFLPWQTDMRPVYAQTLLLLVPSTVEEAFGRVVVEAQISGIPVVASDRGGLPESVGEGGIILGSTDPPERWAEAVEAILSDPDRMSTFSECARANAARDELDPERIADRFEELLLQTARKEKLRPAAGAASR